MLAAEMLERIRAIDIESSRLARNVLRQPALRKRAAELTAELLPIAKRAHLFKESRAEFGTMLSESLLDLQYVTDEEPGMMSLRLARIRRNKTATAEGEPN
jgi:hypothetical protein